MDLRNVSRLWINVTNAKSTNLKIDIFPNVTEKYRKTSETLFGDSIHGEIGVVSAIETLRIIGLQGRPVIEANIYELKKA